MLTVLNGGLVAIVADEQFRQHDRIGKSALRICESAFAAKKSARVIDDVLQVVARGLVLGNRRGLVGIFDHHLHQLVAPVVGEVLTADIVGVMTGPHRAYRMVRDESVDRDNSPDPLVIVLGGEKVRALGPAAAAGEEDSASA